jgi:hypothetical protein
MIGKVPKISFPREPMGMMVLFGIPMVHNGTYHAFTYGTELGIHGNPLPYR